MAITHAEIEAKVDAAVTAAEGGDYSTAINKLQSAKALLAVLPDTKTAGPLAVETTFDRAAIDSLIASYRQSEAAAKAATLGAQRTKIKYVAPTD